jgi:hypothetical protein
MDADERPDDCELAGLSYVGSSVYDCVHPEKRYRYPENW